MEHLTTFGASPYAIGDLHLFGGINDPVVAELLADCKVILVPSGQTVLDSNSKGARLFIVLRGSLGVTQTASEARLMDGTVSKILPGECVGELSVLDEESNSSNITALEESELLVIEADRLWRLIDESNDVARNMLRLMSFRIRAANAQIRRRHKVGEFYRQLSMVDGLTGLQNRAWLNNHLSTMVSTSHEVGNPLSIILIDLDHFKKFNDQHGHLIGDEALKAAANVLIDTLRPRDFAVRYGGEELMVILPNTNLKASMIVAERLCEQMRQAIVFADMHKPLPHITASFGVATLAPEQDAEMLIATADAALYRAKDAGRNQVAL
ncbi:MAG: GGDEF domain-containing protein [Burkholderiaceae bacterium]